MKIVNSISIILGAILLLTMIGLLISLIFVQNFLMFKLIVANLLLIYVNGLITDITGWSW